MRILTFAFFFSAFLLLFALFFHNIVEFDQDLGRHLLMGEIISSNWSVPQTNLLSYTYPNFPFVNTHWLSEVVFYKVGVPGVLYLKIIILSVAFLLTTYSAYKYSRSLAATAVAFLFFVPILLERTEIRPEIFSYLFTAIFMYLLLIKKKYLWTLPLIQILWVNMHIYFIIGPILLFLFAVSKWKEKKYWILLAITCVCCLFNPNGFLGAFYPLRVFDNYGYSIVENQNLFFLASVTDNLNIVYFWIACGTLLASFFLTKKILIINILLSALIVLPILHIRSLPLFFLILLPVAASNLAHLRFEVKFIKPGYVTIFVIAITIFRIFRLVSNDYYLSIDSNKRFGEGINESGKGAVEYVLKNKLNGPIFNSFDNGSYLDYRLYPKVKVFVDGRPEAYPVNFFQGVYIPMQMSTENFNKVDKIYKFKTIIFNHTDGTPWATQFLSEIGKNPNWHLNYLDPYSVVLSKKSNNFKIVQGKDYLENLKLASLFYVLGDKEKATTYLEKAYVQNSNSPLVTSALSQVYLSDPSKVILGQKIVRESKGGLRFF